jgi:mono/diheme cytochrome c family protein
MINVWATIAVMLMAGSSAAQAQLSPSAQRGMTFARANCSHCHAIDKVSSSPLAIAPPFRTLHQRYPVETLKQPLSEGIVTGHANMPEFKLDPDQVTDVINYLTSLQE